MKDEIDRRAKELIHYCGVAKYYDLIYSNFKYIKDEFDNKVPIRLTDNLKFILSKGIQGRGAISWILPISFPRRIESINFDITKLGGLNLFFSFLHEVGHAKDYNNSKIKIETNESEISAWKNVLLDLERFDVLLELEDEFQRALDKYLYSYVKIKYSINKLRHFEL